MATTVVAPESGSSAGLIVGLVLAGALVAGAIIFAIPYLQNQQPQQSQPANINVTVPNPMAQPAPAAQKQPGY